MANITLLHWNIETFSTKKLNNRNGQALIDYIARIVARSGANIISLVEIKNSAVNAVVADLIPAIDIATLAVGPTQWRSISIDNRKNGEAYLILWKKGNGFVPLTPEAGGKRPINGLTNQALVGGFTPGGSLRFPSRHLKTGGRIPYYVSFETTPNRDNFSIIAYHAMFGKYTSIGVRSMGRLAQSRAILDDEDTVDMNASFTTGDFNIDFNVYRGEYDPLLNNLPSSQSTNQRTSLVNTTPPNGHQDVLDYRANAYDNIFKYQRVGGPPPANDGTVPDLINESTLPVGGGNGVMALYAGGFDRRAIKEGRLIQKIPPEDFEDGWHIVRHGISNHYPVYVTFAI